VDGWSGTLAPGGAYDDYVLDTCGQGGALVAALGDTTKHLAITDRATWAFSAPTFASLVQATTWSAGDNAGGGTGNATYQYWVSSPKLSSVIDSCIASLGCAGSGEFGEPFSGTNMVAVPEAHLGSQILVSAGCGGVSEPEAFECPAGKGDANGYAAAIYLYAADLTLEQTAGPTASAVGGELASAPAVAGTSDLSFNASDPGAGVYEAVFRVDGSVVQRTVINENGGRCRDVGETTDGLPAFLYLQPCPASVSADVPFNTAGLANGEHHLTVTVLDAAGNSAPVLDRTVAVANPVAPAPLGAPNGVGAAAGAHLEARWVRTPKTSLTSSYGRTQTIAGRLLTRGGTPIADATIEVSTTPGYAGAKTTAMTAPRTGADGRFTLALPAKADSQTVVLAYRARLGEPSPAASRTLELAVRAPVSLTIRPRVSGVGQTIYFHGSLLGGPYPKGGKPVILEARAGGGGWIEFDVVRSDVRGRFHASYRFRFPGPVHYQFRALCEHEADYPYATGASPAVGVLEH